MKNIFINTAFFLLVFFCSCYDKDNFGEDYKLEHSSVISTNNNNNNDSSYTKNESPYLGSLKYGNQTIKIHSAIIEKQNLRFDDKVVYNISITGMKNKSSLGTISIKFSLTNDIQKTINGEYVYDVDNNTLKNIVSRIDSGSFTLSRGSTKYIVDVVHSGKILIKKNSLTNVSIFIDVNLSSGKKLTGLLINDFEYMVE